MNKKIIFLISIYILVLGVRSYIALEQPNFSDDRAYFALRQIDEIRDTGTPVYNDGLSYGGRTYIFLPLFHYLMAFFSIFFDSILVAKIVPNILASTTVIGVYLIVKNLTKDDVIALFSGFASGFVPVYVQETVNSVSLLSVTVPATLFLFYFMFRIRTKRNLYYYLMTLCIFLLVSPYSLLTVIALVLFVTYSWVEGFKSTRSEIELTLFSLFLAAWFNMVFYRDALLMHGHTIIWQNIPDEVINVFFMDVDLLSTLYKIGIIPLLAGAFVLYYYLFKKKKKQIYLLLSMVLIVTFMLLQKYIELDIGLSYIGMMSIILLGQFLHLFVEYVKRTKLSNFSYVGVSLVMLLLVISSTLPSISFARTEVAGSDSKDKVFALKLLKNISDSTGAVAGSVFDGHLISYQSGKKNIIDSNFLLVDSDERLRDIKTLYTSAIESKPSEIMRKYDCDFLIVTEESKRFYNISRIAYVDDTCFPLLYSGKDVRIYEHKC